LPRATSSGATNHGTLLTEGWLGASMAGACGAPGVAWCYIPGADATDSSRIRQAQRDVDAFAAEMRAQALADLRLGPAHMVPPALAGAGCRPP
jgi:hypothetical protein